MVQVPLTSLAMTGELRFDPRYFEFRKGELNNFKSRRGSSRGRARTMSVRCVCVCSLRVWW